MPSALTHYYFARRTAAELGAKNISVEKDAFCFGSQGPDVLFSHRFMQPKKSLSRYGSRVHHENPLLFLELCEKYIKETNFAEPGRSYVLGVLCHYMLDSTAHPYVHAKMKELSAKHPKKTDDYPWHTQIETCIDIIILRYETGSLPTDISLRMCAPKNKELWAEIGRFWQYILKNMFDVQIDDAEAARLGKDMRTRLGLRNNRVMIKKPIFEFGEKLLGLSSKGSAHLMGIREGTIDYANNSRRPWAPPQTPDDTRNLSFFDLYEQTIIKTAKILPEFLSRAEGVNKSASSDNLQPLWESRNFSGKIVKC